MKYKIITLGVKSKNRYFPKEEQEVDFPDLDSLRAWALDNLDLTRNHRVYKNNRFCGVVFKITMYLYNYGELEKKVFNCIKPNYFMTEKEAFKDYQINAKEAYEKLDRFEESLKKLVKETSCVIDYFMDGDTYGIHKDYMYLSTKIGRYTYKKIYE